MSPRTGTAPSRPNLSVVKHNTTVCREHVDQRVSWTGAGCQRCAVEAQERLRQHDEAAAERVRRRANRRANPTTGSSR